MKKIMFLIFVGMFSMTNSYSQQKARMENGTQIVVYPDGTWIYESELNASRGRQANDSKIITNIDTSGIVLTEPRFGKEIKNFRKDSVDILDYKCVGLLDGYFEVKSLNGRIGWIRELSVDNYADYREIMIWRKISKARRSGQDLLINNIAIDRSGYANGVSFVIKWLYTNPRKTIKYIYFTVVPYNSVGDIQKCEITGRSAFTGQETGPINFSTYFEVSYMENAWYNPTITCIKLIKVRVEYMDGSRYTYIRELPKILDKNFRNSCK